MTRDNKPRDELFEIRDQLMAWGKFLRRQDPERERFSDEDEAALNEAWLIVQRIAVAVQPLDPELKDAITEWQKGQQDA